MTAKDTIIQADGFGFAPSNVKAHSEASPFEIVRRYTLTNKNGASVRLISWGAGIQSIRVPNDHGVLGDVTLGFDNIDGYLQNRRIGRITNHVTIGLRGNKNSLFQNYEKLYHTNDESNGLDNVNWESYILDRQVVMSYLRCQDGHPANMLIQTKYSWTEENELNINMCATVTAPTPANLTNYCLLNLAGHGMGAKELKNHVVTINSDKWIDFCTAKNLSTVTHHNVDNCTLFDLRTPMQLKYRLHAIPGGGYHHNFCINSPSKRCYRFYCRILHPGSGRFLELYSDQPVLQFYTANNLPDPEYKYLRGLEDHIGEGYGDVPIQDLQMDGQEGEWIRGEIRGKDGVLYRRHGGFVLSPQSIPARIIYPGKVYEHNMTYKFGVRSKND